MLNGVRLQCSDVYSLESCGSVSLCLCRDYGFISVARFQDRYCNRKQSSLGSSVIFVFIINHWSQAWSEIARLQFLTLLHVILWRHVLVCPWTHHWTTSVRFLPIYPETKQNNIQQQSVSSEVNSKQCSLWTSLTFPFQIGHVSSCSVLLEKIDIDISA